MNKFLLAWTSATVPLPTICFSVKRRIREIEAKYRVSPIDGLNHQWYHFAVKVQNGKPNLCPVREKAR